MVPEVPATITGAAAVCEVGPDVPNVAAFVPMAYFESLASVQGLHVLWSDLFKQDWAMKVWLELGLGTFDTVRWDQARKMRVTSIIGSRKQNMAVMRRLKAENPLL